MNMVIVVVVMVYPFKGDSSSWGGTSGHLSNTLSPHFLSIPLSLVGYTPSFSLIPDTPFESVLSPVCVGCSSLPSAATTVGFDLYFEEKEKAKNQRNPRESTCVCS